MLQVGSKLDFFCKGRRQRHLQVQDIKNNGKNIVSSPDHVISCTW